MPVDRGRDPVLHLVAASCSCSANTACSPDFVSVGKGFPGGEYPASRQILSTARMDTLDQFGALVTNGQEELASLAYLVTMEFVRANGAYIAALGRLLREAACASWPRATPGWSPRSRATGTWRRCSSSRPRKRSRSASC